MVVMCQVTWIMVFVVRGPPKRLGGSVTGDSFLTTRISPPTPWMAAPTMASDPATISGTSCMVDSIRTVLYGWTERDVRPNTHATEQLDRSGAAGAGRRRPGRRPDRAAGPS